MTERESGPVVVSSQVWSVPRTVTIPSTGDEKTMLVAYLEHYRETLALKCAGLDPERLRERNTAPSTMSLQGLVRHLAGCERWWFATHFAGLDVPMLYYTDENPDLDFDVPADADPADDLRAWHEECARSRQIVADAVSLDEVGARERHGPFTLRWLMLRMIAEYAQHCGHADLLREATDGAVGA
jgi:Protein of unknown function (DUF664)